MPKRKRLPSTTKEGCTWYNGGGSKQVCCKAVNCKVTNWNPTSWSACTKKCGGGKQARTASRTITTPAAYGGTVCPKDLQKMESQSCTKSCPGAPPTPPPPKKSAAAAA